MKSSTHALYYNISKKTHNVISEHIRKNLDGVNFKTLPDFGEKDSYICHITTLIR